MTKLVGYHAGFPFSEKTMKTLMEYPFDLIHCHCPITSAVLARELRSRIHVPTVFTYHTKFDIDIANAIHAKLLQEGAKKLLVDNISAFDEVWTVSRGAGENLRSLGYEGDWRVMPNGVDFARGRVPDALVQETCGGFDLPEGVSVFLFVGRMMWYKGLRITLGYVLLLLLLGCVREWMALGTVFGLPLLSRPVLPMASMPAGGFIVLGVLCAVWRALAARRKAYLVREARSLVDVHAQKEADGEQ